MSSHYSDAGWHMVDRHHVASASLGWASSLRHSLMLAVFGDDRSTALDTRASSIARKLTPLKVPVDLQGTDKPQYGLELEVVVPPRTPPVYVARDAVALESALRRCR